MGVKVRKRPEPKVGYSYDPRRDGVSQSILEGWLNCRQLAYLKTVCGLTPKTPSRPLIHGAISHGALELGLKRIRSGKATAVSALQRAAAGDVAMAHEAWGKGHDVNVAVDTVSSGIAEEAAALLRALLPEYWGRWGKKDIATRWLKVEDQFRVPIDIGGVTVLLVGKYDAVYEGKRGRPCLLETKNKSMWSESLADLLPLDLQLGTYLTALAATEKADPAMVTYNLVRRPGERRGKSETLEGLAKRVGENARRDPDHYFQRLEIELTSQEKARHKERVRELVSSFYAWWTLAARGGADPSRAANAPFGDLRWNSSHCENKYGVCTYLPICGREDYSGFFRRQVAHPELAA